MFVWRSFEIHSARALKRDWLNGIISVFQTEVGSSILPSRTEIFLAGWFCLRYNIFVKKITFYILLSGLFFIPLVTHAAWWNYINDKTLISFIKSLFLRKEFVAYKNELSWDDLNTKKPQNENIPLANAVASAKNVAATVSNQTQATAVAIQQTMVDGPLVDVFNSQYTSNNLSFATVQSGSVVAIKSTSQARSNWVSFAVTTTKPSNYLYFDLDFTSDSVAQGIFTAFLDGKDLGYMDERFYGTESKKQIMGFDIVQPGTYIFTLRLDQSGDLPSSVVVKNIGTGFFSE